MWWLGCCFVPLLSTKTGRGVESEVLDCKTCPVSSLRKGLNKYVKLTPLLWLHTIKYQSLILVVPVCLKIQV